MPQLLKRAHSRPSAPQQEQPAHHNWTAASATREKSMHSNVDPVPVQFSLSVGSDSLQLHRLYSSWNFPGQNTGVDSHSLFQDIFPTQGSNPGLPHCRQILYQLSHKGSPEYREELDNKGFNHSDNQNGVVIHLE